MDNNTNKCVEEKLHSQAKLNEYKEREFREYLVQEDVTLAIVKFLLSIRNQSVKPDSPSQVLIDYFSAQKDERAYEEYNTMQEAVKVIKTENEQLTEEIAELQNQIKQSQDEKVRKREEEERLRLEEENKKNKNSKKPQKK